MKAVQASPNQVSYNTYVCGSCNKTAEKLQKCAGCYFILYCDRNCQKKDWPKHKDVCQQKKYLEVAQESAAILVNKTTPQTLQYLFTKRIQTCIVIMAKGKNGVALIHDGGHLTEKSIKDVFQRIGPLEFWATAANPNAETILLSEAGSDAYDAFYGKNGGIYPTQMKRIRQIMTAIDAKAVCKKQKKPKDADYYRASEEWACIDRNGEIYTQAKPEFDKGMRLDERTFLLRVLTNQINSILNIELHCNLQFNGENFTPIPQLIQNEETLQFVAQLRPLLAIWLRCYRSEKARLLKEQNNLGKAL